MDRLTKQWEGNPAVPTKFDLDFAFQTDDEAWHGLTAIFNLLAQYESTGLTPEEIIQLNDFEHSQRAILLAERDRSEKVLDLMAERLGENDDCPAAATGCCLWPECNGEAEACGDNRTVGGCWKKYFLEKVQGQEKKDG